MWAVFIFLSLGVLHCTVSPSPPSPINVSFSSVNLRNTLQWHPGNGTLDGTHFTVHYAIYGDSIEDSKGRRMRWRAVRACTEIMRSWCDLSNETWDLEQGYYARVRAVSRKRSSNWVLTQRFDPKSDTSFGPPLVSVETEDNNAIITLTGPMRYQPDNETPVISMAALYPQMIYNLSIHNTRRGQMSHLPVISSQYKYRLMDYDTEYCFSANTKFLSMPVQCQPSAWHCITTPPDPLIGQLKRVIVGIVVPSVCMCMLLVAGYLLYHYLSGKGQKSPYILNPPSFSPPPLTFPPENPNIIFITVIKTSDIKSGISEPACSNRWRPIAESPPGYAPQRSETPQEVEEPWDDEATEYGFVGVAPKTDARGEADEKEMKPDGGKDGNNLTGEHQKCTARESYEKKEWRVEDDHSIPQAKSYLSQTSTNTCSQTHRLIHTQTEVSTLLQAKAWLQANSVLQSQSQTPLLSFEGANMGELHGDTDNGEFPGLFLQKTPQIGLFHIPLNLQANTREEIREEMDGNMRAQVGKIDGDVEEENESVREPLLSAYASQNIRDMSASHTDQSDFLPDDYGILRLATANETESSVEEEEEQEEGTICIDWDPKTRKLVLPEITMALTKKRGWDGLTQEEKGSESRMGGEEEVNEMKVELTLENVYVRQASEEEAEAQKAMMTGRERRCEADDILAKWDLVISMEQ